MTTSIGSIQRPLYFFHIPKTAGSSINRLIEDSFPADAVYPPHLPSTGCEDDLNGRYRVYRGHLGRLPVASGRTNKAVITLLRDPAARAWSHYRFITWRHLDALPIDVRHNYSFEHFLADPRWERIGENFEARWLAFDPDPRMFVARAPDPVNYDDPFVHRAPAWPVGPHDDEALECEARKTLEACDLVGTVERLSDFTECLSRLLGRRLSPLMRLNASPTSPPMSESDAEHVRRASPIDLRLLERADELLDNALRTLPAVPDDGTLVDVATGPFTQTMDEAFIGAGWHARVHNPEAGWHRWSGPGTSSTIDLPIRAQGRLRLEVDILAACAPEVFRSLRLTVQDRHVRHRFSERPMGLTASANVKLDPTRPLRIEFAVSQTAHLPTPDGGKSPDPAGIAVGDIRLMRRGLA